jgi:hypothetical protein
VASVSPEERKVTLDRMMNVWEIQVKDISSGKPPLVAFLDLSVMDITNAAHSIDCPFCRRHMLLEAHEVKKVLDRVLSESNKVHRHGLKERLGTMTRSVEIVANVLLGGLRRAGII